MGVLLNSSIHCQISIWLCLIVLHNWTELVPNTKCTPKTSHLKLWIFCFIFVVSPLFVTHLSFCMVVLVCIAVLVPVSVWCACFCFCMVLILPVILLLCLSHFLYGSNSSCFFWCSACSFFCMTVPVKHRAISLPTGQFLYYRSVQSSLSQLLH